MCTSGNRELDSALREVLAELQCPVCMHYMTPPIPMCQNGHNICNTCRQQVKQCPTCGQQFVESRCWLLENILGKVKYPCQYYKEGCQYVSAAEHIESHETRCPHRPFNCPFSVVVTKKCCWKGHISRMWNHVSYEHFSFIYEHYNATLQKFYFPLNCTVPGPSHRAFYRDGETFLMISRVINMDLYCCFLYVGPEEKASTYNYTVTIKTGVSGSATVCLPTKSYFVDVETIFRNQDCAVFSYMMWSQCVYPNGVSCEVQIRRA